MIPDRVLALAVVAGVLTSAWLALRWRSGRIRANGAADLVAQGTGSPVILAFSTLDCGPCTTFQKPALNELLLRFPDRVRVKDIDATSEPGLTRRFGILTVPSTVVIDAGGGIVAINQGPARWEKLAGQLGLNGGK